MFRNNIKTAIRSLLINKGFTFLNVTGLALGLVTCLLIIFYVVDELSYDRYNSKADRIFRVNTDAKFGATATSFAIAAPAVAPALIHDFPEVEKAVRLLPVSYRFKKREEDVQENRGIFSDPGIFDIFTLPMIQGDPASALSAPNSIVITERTAKKYFNRPNVVGQNLTLIADDNGSTLYKITGVIHDIPAQSHFNVDYILSIVNVPEIHNDNFFALYPFNTYVLLRPGSNYKNLEAKFPAFMRKSLTSSEYSYDEFEKSGNYLKINMIPLKDIHLQSNRTNELGTNGSIQYIYIFSTIALLILLIACSNFMNLSTARSANRAREVGVRKVLGSPRKYLIAQFLSESVIVTLFASIIAIFAAWALLPLFNQLSGKDLAITPQTLSWLLPSLLIIIIVVGVLAGSYPAFFLSAFQPIQVLKGKLSMGFKGGGFRSFLVVFQFSISIFLLIGTLAIYNQLRYIQNKDLGFNRNQLLIVKNAHLLNNPEILRQELKQLPFVVNATLTRFLPTGSERWHNFGNTSANSNSLQTEFWPVDEDYVKTMEMQLVKGRNFSNQLATDSFGIIINETAAKMLGYSKDPLNKKLYYGGNQKGFNIIGVVKDFNFNSLRDNITPLVMVMKTPLVMAWAGSPKVDLGIRISTTNLPAFLALLENKWKAMSPHQHFEYSFMDEDFDAIYRSEQRMIKIFEVFTTLAIVIACLGLFGLTVYSVEQRNKEISIRKVLGADISAIVVLISKDFLKLVIIAGFITTPIAWLAIQKWLQSFAYRQNIHWWILPIAAFTSVVIAFVTISFQSIKAAMANPVVGLRSE